MASLKVREIEDRAAKDRNDRMPNTGYRCLVCGKPCKDANRIWVWLHGGGSLIVDNKTGVEMNADPEQAPGDCGGYPIGPECYKKHREALAPFVGVKVGG